MSMLGYGKHIQLQIQGWPAGEPITTAAVAATLSAVYGIDRYSAMKITNVNEAPCRQGELTHIPKGVYSKMEATPFGNMTQSTDELIAKLLLRDGEKNIGYIAGPSVLNAAGLCSWMSKERNIANLAHHTGQNSANIRPPGMTKQRLIIIDGFIKCIATGAISKTLGFPAIAPPPTSETALIRSKAALNWPLKLNAYTGEAKTIISAA